MLNTPKPSATPSPASGAKAAEKGGADLRTDKDDSKACSVKVKPGKAQKLGDNQALLALIRRVAEQQGCPQAKPGSTLRLRITVDGTGRITKTERLAGDEGVAAALINKLTGVSSATTAQGAPVGTLEVTINF